MGAFFSNPEPCPKLLLGRDQPKEAEAKRKLMSKPWIHACSSASKFGGKPEDYIEIHNLLDSSKGTVPDNRHRALTHNAWFLSVILEKIFGVTMTNSDGKVVSVRSIGEQHVLEDFKMKFIPSAQDYLAEIEFQDWMQNGNGFPPSCKKLVKPRKKPTETRIENMTIDGSLPAIDIKSKLLD